MLRHNGDNRSSEMFLVHDREADLHAIRGDSFHYSWLMSDGKVLSVEYIPENLPCLHCSKSDTTIEKTKSTLVALGWKIISTS